MVREAMYRSEFEALKVKIRMQALRMSGKALMPAILMATTKGEAEALAFCVFANLSCVESYGTSMPRKNTDKQ